jgi:hypothetical protein
VYGYGWPDANHNFGPQRAEDQRARENQSDQSFQKHNNLSLVLSAKLSFSD